MSHLHKISVTVIQSPQKPTFWQKVQTHTSPRPSNRHNHNKHHPVNKSPTLKTILAHTALGSKQTNHNTPHHK